AGWIEPRPTPVRVAALAPGVVEKLLVVEDQPVKAGDAVAQLVKDDAKLAFDRATADLKLREAELDEAKAQYKAAETRWKLPVHLEATLRDAEASLAKIQTALKNLPFAIRRAEADLKAADTDYEGKKSAEGVVAGVEIDIAKSKRDSATALVEELKDRNESLVKEQSALIARRDALKKQLELLVDELEAKEQADAKVNAATARVEQATVALAEVKLRLDRMTVIAPSDGRVFRLIAHPGARIGSGMTQMEGHDGSTVVTMYQPNILQVRVDVRFEDIPKVSLRQAVEIDNPALPSPIAGQVLFRSSEADIQKNTLQVKVAIADPPPVFKPEMLVDVAFLQGSEAQTTSPQKQVIRVLVPTSLIFDESDQSYVWVADQSDQIARRTQIETGVAMGNGVVEVTRGLNVTTRIIATGTESLRDGDRIRITAEENTIGRDLK
ncbi:MAG: hemolysin D, partial [Planctomycetaceae bacterium]|nr:hemolysin D [Planctomycetaceae bacterium]